MGTIDRGILGGFSGKIGNVVGARWRNKDIMRAKPRKSSKEPTLLQLEQRAKFTLVSKFLNSIKLVLSTYFGSPQGDKSRLNLALSYHLKSAVAGNYPNYTMDYSQVMFSKGSLIGLTGETVNVSLTQIMLDWDDNSNQSNARTDDELLLMWYNATTDTLDFMETGALREDGNYVRTMTGLATGMSISVWAAFRAANTSLVSSSQFLGTITL